jgi:hypothetical protein
VTQYQQDTVGDGSSGAGRPLDIDILQGAIAHDPNYIYVLWRSAGENMIDPFSNWVFFDLDRSTATGARNSNAGFPPLAVGYEFNLGGTIGWNAFNNAGAFVGGAIGKTTATGNAIGTSGADFIEFRISRTDVQPNGMTFNPVGGSQFHFAFVAEDTNGDYYPNAANLDWFVYDTAGVYDQGAPGDATGNGDVDINDYLLIQANSFTRALLGESGDVNDDGFVDFADFHEWKTNFPGGAGAAEAAIAALGIPEPTAMAMVVLCSMGLLSTEGRRKRR